MKRHLITCVFVLCLSALLASSSALAADSYSRVFQGSDFRQTRDSIKTETPHNGGVIVAPRLPGVDVQTLFSIPDDAKGLSEWTVAAVVSAADGSSAGVMMRSSDKVWIMSISSSGTGSLRSYVGKKIADKYDFSVKNLAFPAVLMICRDANGSVIGRLNDVAVASVIREYDMADPKLADVQSVGITTAADGTKEAASASYERVEVSAKGRIKRQPTLREVLLGE